MTHHCERRFSCGTYVTHAASLALLALCLPACSAVVTPDGARLHLDAAVAAAASPVTGDAAAPGDGGCAPGLIACASSCVDPSSDVLSCGGCGRRCGSGEACVSGRCTCSGPGCTSSTGVGDPFDCGPTHTTCANDRVCLDGTCECRPPLRPLPDGRCIDPATDPNHCGASSAMCADACAGGTCVGRCPDGTVDCDGRCVDIRRDPSHCGGCFDRCGADQVCVFGSCVDYQPSEGCTSCPCGACTGDFARCCGYPGVSLPICVDASGCP